MKKFLFFMLLALAPIYAFADPVTFQGTATGAQLNYLSDVTGLIQAQLNAKLATATAASTYQPLDVDLNAWALVTPSSNGGSLVSAANYAAMAALLESAIEGVVDLESMQGAVTDAQVPDTIDWTVLDTDGDGSLADEGPSFLSVTVGDEAYDGTGWDSDLSAPTKNAVRDKFESLGSGTGDITSVWDSTSGAVARLSQAAIIFADGDATPAVNTGNVYITANTGATVVTDFDTDLVNGQPIWIIVNDALTTFDLTSSGLEGVGSQDYVATSGDLIMGVYSTVDSQWHMLFWPSTIGTASLQEGILLNDADAVGSWVDSGNASAARTRNLLDADTREILATDSTSTGHVKLLQDTDETGAITVTGLTATRVKAMRDVADTVLELGGGYAPTGAWDYGGAASVEIPNGTADVALGAAGQLNLNETDEQLSFHSGTNGEISGEASLSLIQHKTWTFDPDAVCDGAVDRLFLMTVGDEAPEGLIIDEWKLSFEADPTTEADLDLKYADAFIGVANAAVIDALDTTAGASTEDTDANINAGAAVPNGKGMYLEFVTAYTEANHQIIFEMWYHYKED